MKRYYHMVIQPIGQWPDDTNNRREYISTKQGSAPDGWRCVGVCGYHEKEEAVNTANNKQKKRRH